MRKYKKPRMGRLILEDEGKKDLLHYVPRLTKKALWY